MSLRQVDGWDAISRKRSFCDVRFETRYRPIGETFAAQIGTFAH